MKILITLIVLLFSSLSYSAEGDTYSCKSTNIEETNQCPEIVN